ncbi:hypothetical protein QQS21_001006 [Conoideocrella luteorostrata]|uniref:Uncharacterized protein n=1 Tax=Conoideocrella luteorostrata TaxID=1105319 RepID=A0AAJ0CXS3_9HYPO|nr:hypothetical protein QQS21_001006 [Conoideocrella luteorostrata]
MRLLYIDNSSATKPDELVDATYFTAVRRAKSRQWYDPINLINASQPTEVDTWHSIVRELPVYRIDTGAGEKVNDLIIPKW